MEKSPSSEVKISSASQKFPAIFGTRKFIFASTRAHHISISCARWLLSTPPSYFL